MKITHQTFHQTQATTTTATDKEQVAEETQEN
jgi:hypothetical protein